MTWLASIDEVQIAFSDPAQMVLKVVAAVIMLSVALELELADLVRVVRRPVAVLVALAAQFLVLPAATVLLVRALDVRPSIALGMILVACCPPGKISNILTLQAKGDVALSVSMTVASNVVSFLTIPFALAFWASFDARTNALLVSVGLSGWSIVADLVVVIALPMGVGLWLGNARPEVAKRLRPWLGRVGLGALLLLVAASLVPNWSVITGFLGAVVGLVLLQDAIAFALGYYAGRVVGLSEASRRAMTFEVGVRNAGLALVLVFGFFDGLGGTALVVAWWSVFDIIAGLAVARWWARAGVPRKSLAR